ncbi:phage tail protein [Sphingobium sp. CFD-2]|uniref:GTA baseplate fiber-binding domain-containing protein n=1 Tax=Sphingobium sp. CFD-2 TaxID=2878542 RepID=UPI00214AD418|nr:phage tail protein [Sphingobium sp. CFD-2]
MTIDPVSLAITAALTAAQMGLQASRKIEGPRLDDLSVTVADYGTPLNYFYGLRRFEGVPIIWAEPLREVKRKRKTKGGKYNEYTYYGSWAIAIAAHQIDAVTRIWFDKHLVYDATGPGPISPFALSKGFSIADHIRIYLGTEDQMPDPRMLADVESKHGAGSCPAYRGVAYIVFDDIPLEKVGNRIPQITVEAVATGDPAYPYESYPYAYATPGNLMLDPSGTYALWGGTTYEIWDLPTRTLLHSGVFSAEVSGDRMGISASGVIYAAQNGSNNHGQGGGRIQKFDAQTFAYLGSLDTGGSYQAACAVLTDGNGIDHILTYAWSYWNRQYHMNMAAPLFGWMELYYGWKVTQYFVDGHGDIWAVGAEWGPFLTATTMYLHRIVDTGARPGSPSSASFTVPGAVGPQVDAAHHDGHFVLQWAGSRLYLIDEETLDIVDDRSFGYEWAGNNWINHDPRQSSIWLGYTEVSLKDLSTIQTVDPLDWKNETSILGTITYISSLHAILAGAGGGAGPIITFRFLDRASSNGVTLGSIADDVAERCGVPDGNADFSALDQTIRGYNWTQGAGRDILEPLFDAHDCDIAPHDFSIRGVKRGGASGGSIDVAEFVRADPRYTGERASDRDLPRVLTFSFADVDAEQQTNSVRVQRPIVSVSTARELSINMTNLALTVDEARQLAERYLRRKWFGRDTVTNAITARELAIEPSDVRTLVLDGISRTVRLTAQTISADGSIKAEWERDDPSIAILSGNAGAAMDGRVPSVMLVPGPTSGFVLDVPLAHDGEDQPGPFMVVAAGPYASTTYWPGADFSMSDDNSLDSYESGWASIPALDACTWGIATNALGESLPSLPDYGSSLNINIQSGELESVTDAEFDASPSLNMALLQSTDGWEYIRFRTATLEVDGSYTLTGLARGCRGTEQHIAGHVAGDRFLLVDASRIKRTMSASEIGDTDYYKPISQGRDEGTSFGIITVPFTAAAQKPYSPVHGALTLDSGTGDWSIDAVRRTRIGGANLDGTDVPLGETAESWSCDVIYDGAVIRTITGSSLPLTYTADQQVEDLGFALTSLSVNLYQVSPALSLRGYPLAISTNTATYGEHAYWRVLMLNNHGDGSFTGLSNIEMRDVQGGPNLATGGTASVSNASSGSAANVFDENSATSWVASGSTNQWAQYHFADPVEIVEVLLYSGNINGIGRLPRDCKVQYSDDGSSWTDAFTFTWDAPLYGNSRLFPQPAYATGYARAWRINVTANNGDPSVTYIEQIEFRATAGGDDQAHPVPANGNGDSTGRAVGTSGTPWGAFNPGDHWGHAVVPAYAGFVFPDPVKVEEVSIENLSTTGRSPRDFTLDYLDDDGVTWITQKSWTGITWSSVPEIKVLSAI